MKTLLKRTLIAVALAIVAFFSTLESAMAVAEPPFTIERQDGDFELRDYPSFVIAETHVEGGFDEASRAGFRRVANYIFGGNVGPDGKPIKIAMTAPVTIEHAGGDQWRLHFVMPDDIPSAGLP